MRLSIVTTMYKSNDYVIPFYEQISEHASRITEDYEIIFVNDGCPEGSLRKATKLKEEDFRVRVVNLSRNFGHHKAMMAGLSIASGKLIFLIDIDLEESPSLLSNFYRVLSSDKDLDVVFGVQKIRKGGGFEKISGNLFYTIINKLSGIKIPQNLITARLMKREYVDALMTFTEKEFIIAGVWTLAGFNQKSVQVVKQNKGNSTYNLSKKVRLAVNLIASLSSKPMTYIFYLGVCITTFSFLFVLRLILGKLINDSMISGYTSTIVSIWLIGGIIIFSIGILGIYLATIFNEVKARPLYIIKEIIEQEKNGKNID